MCGSYKAITINIASVFLPSCRSHWMAGHTLFQHPMRRRRSSSGWSSPLQTLRLHRTLKLPHASLHAQPPSGNPYLVENAPQRKGHTLVLDPMTEQESDPTHFAPSWVFCWPSFFCFMLFAFSFYLKRDLRSVVSMVDADNPPSWKTRLFYFFTFFFFSWCSNMGYLASV